jgi:GxxExxY protein
LRQPFTRIRRKPHDETADFTDYADIAECFDDGIGGMLIHEELSREIIGASMTVLNTLKPGLDEKLYEQALCIELRALGHEIDQQRRFPVTYRDQLIGTLVPDLIVDGLVIVDAKVVATFNDTHIAQMIGYLAITGLELALLVNLKYASLKWKRIVRTPDLA